MNNSNNSNNGGNFSTPAAPTNNGEEDFTIHGQTLVTPGGAELIAQTAMKLAEGQATISMIAQKEPNQLDSGDRQDVREFIKAYDTYRALCAQHQMQPKQRMFFINHELLMALPHMSRRHKDIDILEATDEQIAEILGCIVAPDSTESLYQEIKRNAMKADDISPAAVWSYHNKVIEALRGVGQHWFAANSSNESLVAEQVIQGLSIPLRQKAKAWAPATRGLVNLVFSQAIEDADKLDTARKDLAAAGISIQPKPTHQYQSQKSPPAEAGKKRPHSEDSVKPKGGCFNCGSNAHGAKECPQPKDEAKIKANLEAFRNSRSAALRGPPKNPKLSKPSGKTVVCKLTQRVYSTIVDVDSIARSQGHIAVYEDPDFKSPHAINICHDTCSSDNIIPLSVCRQLGMRLGQPDFITIEDWKGDSSTVLYYPVTLRVRVTNQNVSMKPLILLIDAKAVDTKSTDLILSNSVIKNAGVLRYLNATEPYFPHDNSVEWAPEELAEEGVGSFEVPVPSEEYDPETEYSVNVNFPRLQELRAILRKHRRVFMPKSTPMNVSQDKEFHIDIIEGAAFKKQYPRHVSPAVNDEIEKEVQRWLKEGIIRRSLAPTAAPVVAVRKPDGSIRVCIDYRDLNRWTQRVHSPLPRTDDCLRKMGGKRYFGKMDLRWGFHQLAVSERCRYLTAFVVKSGTYEFTRVPFGLMNASCIYQRRVKEAVADTPNDRVQCDDNTEVFIDDIGLGGSDEDEFLAVLDETLTRLERAGIVVKASKCTFGFPEIEFLGHIANATGVRLKKERIEAVLNMPEPRNQAAVRRFLGVANGFRDFIQGYSEIVAPLTKLTGRNSAWEWDTPQKEAFAELRKRVAEHTMRYHIDYRYPIIVRPDSSIVGTGAVLLQPVDGVERPVIFLSEKYSDAATRWSTIEQEAYAIYSAIMKMESYLLGHHFIVETDHRNLVFMAEATAPKVVRWRLRLQEFDFQIHHIPGVRNEIADTLSRCFVANARKRKRDLTHKERFDLVHNSVRGHFGVQRTIEALNSEGLAWEGKLREEVTDFISKCPTCQKRNAEQGEMHPALASTCTYQLFERVAIDTMGPLPEDEFGNKYVIVIIDMFSRVLELYPAPTCESVAAARALLQWVCRYGMPAEVQSDNGPQYASALIEELLQLLNVSRRYIVPYRPQANGTVERANKEILRHLRAILMERKTSAQWSLSLPLVQRIINTAYHSAIGTYPLKLLFGDAVSATSGLLSDWDDLTEKAQHEAYSAYIETLNAQLRDVVLTSQQFQKEVVAQRLRKSPETPTSFDVGDYVLVKYPSGPPDKLKPFWQGPFQVSKVEGQTYYVRDLLTSKEIPRFVDQLKLFHQEDGADSSELAELAATDQDKYIVEEIIGHRGNPKKTSDLSFKVKWQGYPVANDESDWIPWSEARKLVMVKSYLKNHPKLRYLTGRIRPAKESA